jgi:hypothetical protein
MSTDPTPKPKVTGKKRPKYACFSVADRIKHVECFLESKMNNIKKYAEEHKNTILTEQLSLNGLRSIKMVP